MDDIAWENIEFHDFLVPIPEDWQFNYENGKIKAIHDSGLRLTVSGYQRAAQKNGAEDYKALVLPFLRAYLESGFDFLSPPMLYGHICYASVEEKELGNCLLLGVNIQERTGVITILTFALGGIDDRSKVDDHGDMFKRMVSELTKL